MCFHSSRLVSTHIYMQTTCMSSQLSHCMCTHNFLAHLEVRAAPLQGPPCAHEAVHTVQYIIVAEHAAGKKAGIRGRFWLQDLCRKYVGAYGGGLGAHLCRKHVGAHGGGLGAHLCRKHVGAHGGGLGAHLCRKHVEAHGGGLVAHLCRKHVGAHGGGLGAHLCRKHVGAHGGGLVAHLCRKHVGAHGGGLGAAHCHSLTHGSLCTGIGETHLCAQDWVKGANAWRNFL